MIWVYIASAIFGSAFVIPMLMGGLDLGDDVDFDFDADTGADFEVDTDFDVGADVEIESPVDVGADVGADIGADPGFVSFVGDFVASLINFRSIVLASTFFGLVGIVFSVLGFNAVLVFVTAIVLGLFAAGVNSTVMQYVTAKEASSYMTLADMRGATAEVVLPVGAGRKGRIRAQIAGQTEYFVALPFGTKHDDNMFEVGRSVVVVEIENGTALVSPMPSLDS